MKRKNLIGLLFVAVLLLKGTCAYATVYNGVCGENLSWTLDSEDSTLVISGRGDMSGIQFAGNSFRNTIKYVVFPEGLTSICDYAFGDKVGNSCNNLLSVTLPDSTISIGKKAFMFCKGLQEVRCGKGLKNIGDSAFIYCTALKYLELSDSLESIGNGAFMEDSLLQGIITFPENLKYIGSEPFGVISISARNLTAIWNAKHCKLKAYLGGGSRGGAVLRGFSKIIFGEHVEYITDNLCYVSFCDTIILPESVDSIGQNAFCSGYNLKHIEMPTSLSYIGREAFASCKQLPFIRIPEGISTIPEHAFYNCGALTEVVLPSTLDSIKSYAFGSCYALSQVTLPANTKFIDNFAFLYCRALQHINLPEGLSYIGEGAFRYCSSLLSITIPESITAIYNYTFANCSSLPSITIPERITTISDGAFLNCSALQKVHMPNCIRQIGISAFQNCALDTLILPSELILINKNAFLNNKTLTELVIPDEVRNISDHAFEDCIGLRKLIIGKKTAIINSEAFKNDSALLEIHCRAEYPPLIAKETFAGVPDSTWLFVPIQSIDAYTDDPLWGRFRMQKAEDINYVTVDAEETTANFVWPTDSAAHSYQIDIYKNGVVFCKLTLGNKGQLLAINFSAPRRRMSALQSVMPAAEDNQPYTLSFKVTGLDEASRYNYVLSVLDANGKPLHVYIGDFATLGYEGELKGGGEEVIPTPPIIPSNPEQHTPEGIENTFLPVEQNGKFVFMNGEIRIIRDGRVYTIQGQLTR